MTTTSTRRTDCELHDDILHKYCNEGSWNSVLHFPNCALMHKSDSKYQPSSTEPLDIFSYCKDGTNSSLLDTGWFIRFDPNVYPVPQNVDDAFHQTKNDQAKDGTGYKLVSDILSLLNKDKENCLFLSNGKSPKCAASRRIVCGRSRCYNINSDDKVLSDVGFRKKHNSTLNLENGHVQVDGKKNRFTASYKAATVSETCQVCITIHVDTVSYYIRCLTGTSLHTSHPKNDVDTIVTRRRCIPQEAIDDIINLSQCKAPINSMVLYGKKKHNLSLGFNQVFYYSKLPAAVGASISEDFGYEGNIFSDFDKLKNFLDEKSVYYLCLYHCQDVARLELTFTHQKKRRNDINNGVQSTSAQEALLVQGVVPPVNDSEGAEATLKNAKTADTEMLDFARECRTVNNAKAEQDVVLSMAWSPPHCRRMFQAFPEVVFVDGTFKTNDEKRPLFTVGVRDAFFKMNIVLRAFLPNERAWSFRWLFREAMPCILGADNCKRVKLFITDGDSQEFGELTNAIDDGVFGSAVRRRCGWHICTKGIERHIGFSGPTEKRNLIKILQYWITESFMKDVESIAEYKV